MDIAEVNESNQVVRIIVADSIEWCVDNLGGTWISTEGKTYPYIGHYWDGNDFVVDNPIPAANSSPTDEQLSSE